jgi:hypothetical protein
VTGIGCMLVLIALASWSEIIGLVGVIAGSAVLFLLSKRGMAVRGEF